MNRPRAASVIPLENHTLEIVFDNAEKRVFDVKPYLGLKFFKNLQNIEYFKLVKIGGLSIEWPFGEDICPDELYFNSIPK